MFSYYGSKSKIVGCYPYPKHDKIIEPFAGSARYSLKHFEKDILLVDKYEVIVKIWHYLQAASEQDIMKLPRLKRGDNLEQFNLSEEEKLFVGMWAGAASTQPRNKVSPQGARNYETTPHLYRNVARQLFKIKHWVIKLDDYRNIKNVEATWFIDPPYEFGGRAYKENDIDYKSLAKWSRSRNGQIIVCENSKASWLPFKQMAVIQGSANSFTTEAIWSNQPTVFDIEQIPLF